MHTDAGTFSLLLYNTQYPTISYHTQHKHNIPSCAHHELIASYSHRWYCTIPASTALPRLSQLNFHSRSSCMHHRGPWANRPTNRNKPPPRTKRQRSAHAIIHFNVAVEIGPRDRPSKSLFSEDCSCIHLCSSMWSRVGHEFDPLFANHVLVPSIFSRAK